MKKPKPLLDFRVYTDPRQRKTSPFFYCTVWRTILEARKRMLATTANVNDPSWKTAVGACFGWDLRSYDGKGEMTLKPEMGEIVLCLRHSGGSTIAHECCHAGHRLVRRFADYKIPDEYEAEERICLTTGWMFRQIVKRLIAYDNQCKREATEAASRQPTRPSRPQK